MSTTSNYPSPPRNFSSTSPRPNSWPSTANATSSHADSEAQKRQYLHRSRNRYTTCQRPDSKSRYLFSSHFSVAGIPTHTARGRITERSQTGRVSQFSAAFGLRFLQRRRPDLLGRHHRFAAVVLLLTHPRRFYLPCSCFRYVGRCYFEQVPFHSTKSWDNRSHLHRRLLRRNPGRRFI